MNNKDFLNQLAGKANISLSEAKQLSETFTNMFADYADDGMVFSIQGFGNFEVKKKMERVVVNPSTKQRMIVPPKLVLTFKPSTSVKDKFKKVGSPANMNVIATLGWSSYDKAVQMSISDLQPLATAIAEPDDGYLI